jgi:isopenicillin-N N-acyltransferase like protein
MLRRTLKILLYFCVVLILIPVILITGLYLGITPKLPTPPPVPENIYSDEFPKEPDNGLMVLDKNWIRQNRYGLWEMYVQGDAFNRGVAAGKLSDKLIRYQEEVFIAQIDKVIPSKILQHILLSAIAWMNRKVPEQVPEEFKKEIYGISLAAPEEFSKYGSAYARMLNYHAAHDIGHAMQSYYLVGCSSLAVWNDRSSDSSLLIGRNFDFYFGDDFSRNKIIEFVKPDTGFNFAFITWGGMTGVVSGMNDRGLTVTINAGTLEIGRKAATPVTLVAREILQFAGNIEEAATIAASRRINVSEIFMIGSAEDNKTILIEKTPNAQFVYESDSSVILCTNHFQSENLAAEFDNVENMHDNATGYRYRRLKELINREPKLSPSSIASILRDKCGLQEASIGFGNEKALNQFIAHHGVIFNPTKRIIWVSTNPNVMGVFVAYDLNTIFTMPDPPEKNLPIDIVNLEISKDSFLNSQAYFNYLDYKVLSDSIRSQIEAEKEVADVVIEEMISDNPDYFDAYLLAGDYYFYRKSYDKALINYKIALGKETNSKSVSKYLEQQISHCK